jgi:glycosyltransferase involved in cell wall biosynthesis
MGEKRLKLLFVVSEDWYFVSHRLPLALAAKDAGFEVVIATRISKHRQQLQALGFRVLPLHHMKRSSANPWSELKSLWEIYRIVREERPSIVHAVAIKPIIYSSIACRFSGSRLVGALGGLGSVFANPHGKTRVLKVLITGLFRLLLNRQNTTIIVQNDEDEAVMIDGCRLSSERVVLIRGAGVDLAHFPVTEIPTGEPVIMLASRMIWAKGIREFADAAAILKSKGSKARFILVGRPDPENPASVPESKLQDWHQSGLVEWWGHRDDMVQTLAMASIVCLPTYYGEGVPKVLLEAMASGRPIVTTDTPGCRNLVADGAAGVLVSPRSSVSLAEGLEYLLSRANELKEMGQNGRRLAASDYSTKAVIEQTLAAYL